MKKTQFFKDRQHAMSIFKLSFLILFIFNINFLQAQTIWIGGTDNNWTTNANWNTSMEPTASDDVIIPGGFTVVISTNVSAQSISTSGNLSITSDGILNIDGSTVVGLKNDGTLTNGGIINVGLNSPVLLNGIVNEAIGNIINNGDIFTEEVGVGGTHVILSKGDFTNNGNIDIGDEHHPGAFPILVYEGSLFTNNNTINIENINPFATGKLRVQQAGSELINNGIIDMNTTGLFVSDGGTLTNNACAEILETRASIQVNGTIDNFGLMTMVAFHPNGGDWNNFGTIQSVQTQLINSGNPVSNDDLIILPLMLTNNCGVLSGVFGIGSNLGSTVSIYTDAAATMSAGTYDSGANTYTPNFALNNTTYNLFVKVEDNANTCDDYILPWNLTVVTAPCCNLTTWTGGASTDWDDANNWDTYLVPTACNDVSIPISTNQPSIGGTTTAEAASVTVAENATLDIITGGALNLDTDGIDNFGSITNSGFINVGLTTTVPVPNAISNYATGSFTNNGTITTGQVATTGGGINIQTFGPFENNGSIVIGPGWGIVGDFGIGVYNNGLLTNNGTIENTSGSNGAFLLMQGSPAEILNNGVIDLNTAGVRLSFNGTLTNAACGEILEAGFNNNIGSIYNNGLISVIGTSNNIGLWNNLGTIHSPVTNVASPNAINNQDLIIKPNTLTNNCGELSPAFGVGSNLGSTVSIYTDAGATMSAGAYDSGTNTFTPNFALSNTTYNLFVKVEDNANTCDDYILPWALTVVTAPCCNLTTWTGGASTDWNDANNWDTYLVPTACNDVSIPASTNQPIIDGSTNALAMSVEVAANAVLVIDGVLNIDGSTFRGLGNVGTVTNNGTINMGLNSHVGLNGIVNQNGGSFMNNGSIITGDVANPGRSVVFTSSTGTFTNNGNVEIGYVPGSDPVFGLTVLGSGRFVNNGTVTNDQPSQAIRIAPQGADSPELQNNGVITTAGGIFINLGQFNNTACAELYAVGFNIADASATVNNSGLMQFSNNSTNNGTWNNMGTIHRESEIILSSGTPINNDDLIILDITLTEDCGTLSPAFGIGSNLGSTISIYTNTAGTMSAGTYDSGTNTYTPNFALSNTTYNLFVKVVDANGCIPYILPWSLTVNACTDTDNDNICDSCDPDDDNDGVLDGDDSAPLDNFICQDLDGDGCDDCSSGTADANNDGTDTDGDGLCDLGDPDDDNDGQTDVDEIACGSDPLDDSSTSLDSDADNSPDCVDPTLSVCDAIDALEVYILTLGLPNNTEGFLLNKLGKAKTKYQQGNNNAAIGNLGAFINKVNAKSPSQISPSEAATLIAIANAIIDAINNGNTNCTNSEGFIVPNSGTTMSQNLGFESLDIYPNPATNMVNIKMQGTKLNTQVFIYDNLGRVVFQQNLDQDQTTLEVDLSGNRFHVGVYIVSVISGEYTNAKRLVISK